jgi:hypothetical protein
MVAPVLNGGIPHTQTTELKLIFKEGGAFEFYNAYTALLDRLHLQSDADSGLVEHLEDLPVYSTEGGDAGVENPSTSGQPAEEEVNHPEDLPPTYDDVAAEDGPRGRARTRP